MLLSGDVDGNVIVLDVINELKLIRHIKLRINAGGEAIGVRKVAALIVLGLKLRQRIVCGQLGVGDEIAVQRLRVRFLCGSPELSENIVEGDILL